MKEFKDLYPGRMISGSKSGYCNMYPKNIVIFNANIITKSSGKIWHGDLDITLDYNLLKEFRNEIGEDLYILYEMDARFGAEDSPIKDLINKSVCRIGEDKIHIMPKYTKYFKDIKY